ncbi:MAG: hypothetical protein JEY71_05060 [Sphaerochaeta sp.]|nr:hypothetical protein [Sphaerochaeta sp.]
MVSLEERMNYLETLCFGGPCDTHDRVISNAVKLAYGDFKRTQKGFSKLSRRNELQAIRVDLMEKALRFLQTTQFEKQEYFDKWHHGVMDSLIEMSLAHGAVLNFGQAQKWINMAIKYCIILKPETYEKNLPWYHVPIDRLFFSGVEKKYNGLNIPKNTVWSNSDYLKYKKFQDEFRICIKEKSTPPFNRRVCYLA